MTSGKHLRNLGRIPLNLGRIPCRSIVRILQHLEIFPTVKSDFDNIDKNPQDLIKNKRDGYKPSLISAFSGNSFFFVIQKHITRSVAIPDFCSIFFSIFFYIIG